MSTPITTPKRIIFTGGSGKAGRHILPYLLSHGHQILNLDLIPHPDPRITTLKTDLTSAGEVYSALTSPFSQADYLLPSIPRPDAVIHFAAHARNLLVPDSATFSDNVRATYHVLQAACALGVRKIVLASSETVYGVCFAQGERARFARLPLEEADHVNPEDPYALSKLCGETVARGFARRYGVDVYCLRIGNVIEPEEYARDFPTFVQEPALRMRNAWSYVDARDLGQICERCVARDGLGWQVFNATNSNVTARVPTRELLAEQCPGVEITREMGEWEAPLSNRKVREVLGFRDQYDWRDYVKG